ncbi:hypothetical protein T439DRAFT_323083 [Meredithblackwellia eburnea MCA 4105]
MAAATLEEPNATANGHANGSAAPELSRKDSVDASSLAEAEEAHGVLHRVSSKEEQKVTEGAPMMAPPTAVSSENKGKDFSETFDPAAPAPTNAEDQASPLLCGPILRYTHQSEEFSKWHGSALIVLSKESQPVLHLGGGESPEKVEGKLLYKRNEGKGVSPGFFYRFDIVVGHEEKEKLVEYTIEVEGAKPIERKFAIAAKGEAFNILFHSCNGFCDGAEEAMASGPALWNDVLRKHEAQPFHVMVGGGDQIYSDAVQMPGGPLEQWAKMKSGRHRAAIDFNDELKAKVDQWYFTNSCDWFNTNPFREATSLIPSVNIWDDHDIIDGYGSYKDRWQRSPVFEGIGEIAWRWMVLFQHHLAPEAPAQAPKKAMDEEPAYILHPKNGPYIKHQGLSISSTFGPDISFIGFDCRTDRTQKIICNPDTYDSLFARMEKDVVSGRTKHLLVLLGVPIAYPRLVWLENAMSSPHLVRPLRWISKATGILGGVFNDFDGAVELLDDLQDHWACGLHKKERNKLVVRLQNFAKKKGVRITILSGDVHLAAVGRFYSKKSLNIPQEKDHRYIVNLISSAITNAPPPAAVAQVLNQRNKLHHLDDSTDENLMKIWNVSAHDNSSRINECTYPSRNFAVIRLTKEGDHPLNTAIKVKESEGSTAKGGDKVLGGEATGNDSVRAKKVRGTAVDHDLTLRNDGDEISHGYGGKDALSISIQIEIDSKDKEGKTKGYGFSIPPLLA